MSVASKRHVVWKSHDAAEQPSHSHSRIAYVARESVCSSVLFGEGRTGTAPWRRGKPTAATACMPARFMSYFWDDVHAHVAPIMQPTRSAACLPWRSEQEGPQPGVAKVVKVLNFSLENLGSSFKKIKL
jgi:hypothetical protein